MTTIRLTQTVQKGGCAAKIAALELRKILSKITFPPAHPQLLVDGKYFDDAAIYKVSDTQAMVQTLDFFTPIVDDPYTFGKIAACNAVSDVYAMGGRPVTAMAILAFPLATMEGTVISSVLQGASDLLTQTKCTFVGGHSIDDDTLKFGLSVTGLVHPERIWTNQGAKAGDVLILTKPLGTGTLSAALKRSLITEEDMRQTLEGMAQANNVVDVLSSDLLAHIHAATDITGFGLSGHSYQMAKASQKTFVFRSDALPLYPRAQEFIEKEILTKAHRTNREYTEAALDAGPLSKNMATLIHDPQTSGGLLLSVSREVAAEMVEKLRTTFKQATIIGEVVSEGPKSLLYT
ncbi:MAG: selenide, water dikinase SelD [Bdellovibrionales bacterium GWA2_49_15]|nr:MAG: selenide, water dikinase SelD [Bdellovibrionales bacterium GWA2_49_15]HAZ11535.1 selenide, water dikinase SelD [Bdellovibrionales bacterium]